MNYQYTKDDLTRVNNDVNGNPRYVIHFTAIHSDYMQAVNIARELFHGRKFHNKQYGGGIVFQSYNTLYELALINALDKE